MDITEYITLIIGVLFFAVAIYGFVKARSLRQKGIIATAKVVGHQSANDGHSFEVVEFRDQNGQLRHARSLLGSNFGQYALHERVEIIYDPARPNRTLPNKPILLYFYLLPMVARIIACIIHFTQAS